MSGIMPRVAGGMGRGGGGGKVEALKGQSDRYLTYLPQHALIKCTQLNAIITGLQVKFWRLISYYRSKLSDFYTLYLS